MITKRRFLGMLALVPFLGRLVSSQQTAGAICRGPINPVWSELGESRDVVIITHWGNYRVEDVKLAPAELGWKWVKHVHGPVLVPVWMEVEEERSC